MKQLKTATTGVLISHRQLYTGEQLMHAGSNTRVVFNAAVWLAVPRVPT